MGLHYTLPSRGHRVSNQFIDDLHDSIKRYADLATPEQELSSRQRALEILVIFGIFPEDPSLFTTAELEVIIQWKARGMYIGEEE